MSRPYSVKLTDIIKEFDLEVLSGSSHMDDIEIYSDDVNRPALQMAGFFEYFDPTRLQIIGKSEQAFIHRFTSEKRILVFDKIFAQGIPALIITRGMDPYPECMRIAKKYDIPLLRSQDPSSYFTSALVASLKLSLAPRITRHGVLVEVYGEGVLLLGESGVGKSETAIELVKRGHRLIADDAVELKRASTTALVGTAPELIRHYIELRGIGIIDVRKLFGIGAVKMSEKVDLIINIELWNEDTVYDRLGLENQFMEILGVKIPALTVPVKPGRNLAVIIEVAAMNNRQKKMGYNGAQEFTDRLDRHFAAATAEAEAAAASVAAAASAMPSHQKL